MALPTITLRAAFGSNAFAASPSWTDISADLMALHINRGRQHELDRIEAGTATFRLKNTHGNYWPQNTGGSYYPNILPGVRLNLRVTYNSITYDRFTGFVESWDHKFLLPGGFGAVVDVTAVDLQKALALLLLNDGVGYSQELSNVRIGNVLDDLGWPAGNRDLNTGQTLIIASGAQVNVNAMEHLFNVALSEQGQLFIAGDSDVQWQDRHARYKSPYITSQAIFGDDAGEMLYGEVEWEYSDQYIYNDVRLTRSGGAEQTASNAASQSTYGQRSLSRTDLLMPTDAEADDQAEHLMNRYKTPVMRARSLTVYPQRSEAALWPKALGYDISTRITVRLNQTSINTDYHIEGIEDDADVLTGVWRTKWQLSDADNQARWLIGEAGYSEIGETTVLGY